MTMDFQSIINQMTLEEKAALCTSAMIWCFADYVPELWDLSPCNNSQHERFFGLVRPNGSLKPHAKAIQEFAATCPHLEGIAPAAA
jgi:endo-1,4-beta-mannosidase